MTSEKDQVTDHQDLLQLESEEAENFIEVYSNYVEVGGNVFDIDLSFYDIKQDNSGELYKVNKARIIMSPQNAIVFLGLLKETMAEWKTGFGEKVKEIIDELNDSQ